MKCTSCKQGSLVPSFIEGQFRAHTCPSCNGYWILIEAYISWKERNKDYEFSNTIEFEESDDTKSAILCPVTGIIMRKFRLSASNDHRIDYSSAVGGIWLDKGEWELLKQEGLAGSLNAVVTEHWQKKIRENSARDNFSDIYAEKFGKETYKKISEIRAWLLTQDNKADLRAYLLAEDPYSAQK